MVGDEAGENSADAERLDELREEVRFLRGQVEAQQRQIERDAIERAELRRLLAIVQQQLHVLLPASAAPPESAGAAPVQSAPGWWREFRQTKRGLGASLTLTGIVAIVAGVILHLALQHQVIESTIHLGYIVGLVGLFSLLIGLVLVF